MSASLFSDRQLMGVGVVVGFALWYAQRKAGNVIEGAVDSAFGLDGWIGKHIWDSKSDIELTEDAKARRDRWLRLGYLKSTPTRYGPKDEITPLGEIYLQSKKEKNK